MKTVFRFMTVFIVLCTSSVATAQSLDVRATGVFLNYELWSVFNDPTPSTPILAGVQLGLVLENGVAAELQADALLGLESFGFGAALRGGYVVAGHGTPNSMRGRLLPMVGYRYARRPPPGTSDGYDLLNDTHSAQVGMAYDLFWGAQTAFTMRFATFYDYSFSSQESPDEFSWTYSQVNPVKHSLMVGIWLGMSFHL